MNDARLFKPGPRARALSLSFSLVSDQDLDFLKSVYRSTREIELVLAGWEEWQVAEFIHMQFSAQNSHYQQHYPDAQFFVIKHEDVPIGRLYIEEWTNEFRIIDIALLQIGRNKGFGTAILMDIGEFAKGKSKKVGIHVEKQNPAKQLYERLGFVKSKSTCDVYDLMHWKP